MHVHVLIHVELLHACRCVYVCVSSFSRRFCLWCTLCMCRFDGACMGVGVFGVFVKVLSFVHVVRWRVVRVHD